MECRFHVLREGDVRIVVVAGRLSGAHVPDLLSACAGETGRVRVDLADLVSADAIAIDALRRVRQAGAELVGASPYLRLTLDSPADSGT